MHLHLHCSAGKVVAFTLSIISDGGTSQQCFLDTLFWCLNLQLPLIARAIHNLIPVLAVFLTSKMVFRCFLSMLFWLVHWKTFGFAWITRKHWQMLRIRCFLLDQFWAEMFNRNRKKSAVSKKDKVKFWNVMM